METKVVEIHESIKNSPVLERRIHQRTSSRKDFIEKYGSGTIKKAMLLGCKIKDFYLEERVAFVFGWEFEVIPSSRIKIGEVLAESDCKSQTEAFWHILRYRETNIFPNDIYLCKYIEVEYSDGIKKEGIGIFVSQTSAKFIPKGNSVFSIISEFSRIKNEYKDALNPF